MIPSGKTPPVFLTAMMGGGWRAECYVENCGWWSDHEDLSAAESVCDDHLATHGRRGWGAGHWMAQGFVWDPANGLELGREPPPKKPRQKVVGPIACEYCGKEFTPRRLPAKFCSNTCRTMSWRKRQVA